jgi:hypothetical protein
VQEQKQQELLRQKQQQEQKLQEQKQQEIQREQERKFRLEAENIKKERDEEMQRQEEQRLRKSMNLGNSPVAAQSSSSRLFITEEKLTPNRSRTSSVSTPSVSTLPYNGSEADETITKLSQLSASLDSIHQFPQKLDASSTSAKVSGIFIGLVT